MGDSSTSRKVTKQVLAELAQKYPQASVTMRDLTVNPLPHLQSEQIAAFFTKPDERSPELREAARLSDEAVAEFLSSDVVVLSTPMWNFGVPSAVKAWIDHIVRAGVTFRFGPNGLEGLAAGKRVIVVTASGSVFSQGPFAAMDFVAPYLRGVFGFMGVTDFHLVRAEGLNDPKAKDSALTTAASQIATAIA